MKRLLSLILPAVMLLCLFGCGGTDADSNTVSFYYLRGEYSYGASDSVIASEARDISARHGNLNYYLRLYLAGPLDDTLRTPFPKGVRLVSTLQENTVLTVVLSEEISELQGIQLTLTGACIASTCFDLTDAETVVIHAGDSDGKPMLSLTQESLTLLDDSTSNTETVPATGG